ncbi:MAG: Crp/Fnr family transcriptional regulator [Tannerellaceae bacterium]|nr:Crp/Fnr family transcriptional regulator [Tannerellaceae bacterium]
MVSELEIAKLICNQYGDLPVEEQVELAKLLERKEAKKGELILAEGQISRSANFVYSGMLRQFYYKNGRDITEHFTCEGYFCCCLVSLFKQVATHLMIEAIEDCIIYAMDYRKLTELAFVRPRIAAFKSKMLEEFLIISQEKADSWRFETVKERYERFTREYPEAAKRASVNHIASYLLMTPESLSRIRSGQF